DLAQIEPPDFACPSLPDPAWPDLGIFPPLSPSPTPVTVLDHGGARLNTMEAWVVVGSGDAAFGVATNRFLDWLFQADYWRFLQEYGVGRGTARGVIVLPGPAPSNDTHIADSVTAAWAQLPSLNAQTTVFLLLPKGAGLSCIGCGGYHSELQGR